ncbi:response regulator transcription factor [Geobacter sp.]|uniref:response regulator transcription factor n=1 Tax=Geobacter sp. TaxID=46610 RepID=UPI00260599B7|nr:response regulator transcription factor [Geobacter sp.]
MDGISETPRMKVLINLSSRILCEALQEFMEKDAGTYKTMVPHNLDKSTGFEPDKILVDAPALEESLPVSWSGAKVILIDTGLAEEEVVRLLFTHKLHGVISTDTGSELFHKALHAIRDGQVWVDNVKLKALLHNPPLSITLAGCERFSKKEQEIVLLIAEGCKNREIATQLNISERTVKTHLSRIFKKANITSRAQLAPLALKFRNHATSSA